MTAPAWLAEAREAVDDALATATVNDRASNIAQVVAVLDEADGAGRPSSAFSDLVAAARLGLTTGWLSITELPDSASALASLDRIARGDVTASSLRSLSQHLPSYIQQLRARTAAGWRTHVTRTVGGVEDLQALSVVLRAIPGQRDASARLATALTAISTLNTQLPDLTAEERLNATAVLVNEAFDEAVDEKEVRDFLIACSRTGATMTQLSPSVRTWIEQNNAADRFIIQLWARSDS